MGVKTHAGAGNLLGLALSPYLLGKLGWRALFCIYGVLGGPLLAFWLAAVPATSTSEGEVMPVFFLTFVLVWILLAVKAICIAPVQEGQQVSMADAR